MDKLELLEFAKEAMRNAYAPYSNAHVGAAVLTIDNKVFKGCNVENASYGLTCCAERNALFNACCNGYKNKDIVALAISSDFNNGQSYPCGACRQVIIELMEQDADIYMIDKNDNILCLKVKDLLPHCFTKDFL